MPRHKIRGTYRERKAELAQQQRKKTTPPNVMRTPSESVRDLRAARRRQAEAIKKAGG